ncbi:PEP-CTERM sorting domain-containing protein [Marinobacter sp. KM021]|jgi:hypothetical protein|uniref:PEP-CTERM sorting domain-containing protein n=1 Tax=Marinobacter sp. KM021 TaxID=3075616 RepID=UPI003D6BC773
MTTKGLLKCAFAMGLAVTGASVQAGIISTANETIQLIAVGVEPNTASIAYDPTLGLYYGSRAGSSSYSAAVWDDTGALQQTLSPLNADARGWNYNSNSGQLELVTFTSDLLTVGRDASGFLTGTYTTQLNDMSGSPNAQSMLSYNASLDVFYGISSGPSVSVIDHATGALSSSFLLDFAAAGISSLNSWFLGYDEVEDALIGTSGDSAYIFSTSGDYLGSSLLGFNPDSDFDAGYANGQLFVYSNSLGGFQGYDLFDDASSVPEPSTLAILGLGLAGLGLSRRRRAV